MPHCPSCGVQSSEQARFCSQCGAPLQGQAGPGAAAPHGKHLDPRIPPSGDGHVAGAVSDETLWTGRPSRKQHIPLLAVAALALAGSLIGLAIVGVGSAVMWVPLVLVAAGATVAALYAAGQMVIDPWNHCYWLTSDRLFIRRGILWRQTDQTELIRVDDLTVRQGVLDRVFGIGSVTIMCDSDRSHQVVTLDGIEDPLGVAEMIRQSMHELRRRRGLFLEQL